MKLKEIASRINAHLRRMEADPKINKVSKHGGMRLQRYWQAGAGDSGNRIFVTYVSYQGQNSLTKAEAMSYLEWLDAGNSGKHWTALAEIRASWRTKGSR